MADYPLYWNSEKETLSAKEYRFIQEKAFLNQLAYVWKNSSFLSPKKQSCETAKSSIRHWANMLLFPWKRYHGFIRQAERPAAPLISA
jgi:phenylacetate-coenzyme A ligase PaaK-like adenylate-forming protein